MTRPTFLLAKTYNSYDDLIGKRLDWGDYVNFHYDGKIVKCVISFAGIMCDHTERVDICENFNMKLDFFKIEEINYSHPNDYYFERMTDRVLEIYQIIERKTLKETSEILFID